jgi:2,4-dienoyl-CoA reductase-like NADH-dependent reductase (Old Yellow Enzyme family)
MAMCDPLLQPFQLRHLTLKNRIMSTAHAPNYVEDAKPKERYQLYHEEKAKGGLALTMFGGSSNVAPDSPSVFGQIDVGDDSVVPYLGQLAERVHRYGAAVMCQITHMGRRTYGHVGDWLPVIGPSHTRERAHRAFPKEMEESDILRVVEAFADAAGRCKEAGLDGIEILAAGHLVGQFLSPAVNKRRDRYGGSVENRLRFALEVLDAVRERVGGDTIVGLRVPGDEFLEDGLSGEDCVDIAERLAASGLVDFLNVNASHIYTDSGLAWNIPVMNLPSAPFLRIAGRIKRAVDLPVFHAAGIADLATARHAVEAGLVDMVGMTRAHIADPHIVRKLERGEEERIRPCVGAGLCIDRLTHGLEALCVHNPATGREATLPQQVSPSDRPGKKVVVVGGGPGGLEAARVAALRGHRVVLFEAAGRLGGQINLAARPASRQRMIGIADWLAAEVERLGVDLRTNTYAEAETVTAEEPDVVIVATGGLPNTEIFAEGAEGAAHVASVWDVLGGHVKPSGEVLLYDDNGRHQGVSCAEFLAAAGARVELVTPDRAPAFELGAASFPIYLRDLYKLGVRFTPDQNLVSVRREGNRLVATLRNEYSEAQSERSVDHVVVDHGTLPQNELFVALKTGARNLGELDQQALLAGRPQDLAHNPRGTYQLFRIGDAVAGRDIHAAVLEALRLCKDL